MNAISFSGKRVRVFLCFVLLFVLFKGRAVPTQAITSPIIVNIASIVDDENDGECDLYEALKAAFDQKSSGESPTVYHECTALGGPKEIILSGYAASNIIILPTGAGSLDLPMINDDVTIIGPAILDGAGAKRIFNVSASGNLTLRNLTLQNGYTSGGGGAILSSQGGQINLIGSSVLSNEAENDGGAINTTGELNIIASNFAGNSAGRDGGAIYQGSSYKRLRISSSTFNGNMSVKTGGAVHLRTDNAEIADTIFNSNILSDDNPNDDSKGGGAIYMQQSELVIERSVFNGNLSLDGNGGAIATSLSTELMITHSAFNGNIAGDLSSAHLGGAIYTMEVLDIRGVTFLNNLSLSGDGGAIFNDRGGVLDVANATFSANGAPDGDGGALYNGNTQSGSTIASHATFRNVTLYANTANNNGAALFNQTGNHTISLGNTIIDDASGPNDNCNRALTSLGNNLDSGSSCGLNGSGDLTHADADLAPLSFNGGPLADLFTHLPGENSAAVDAGSNSICSSDPVDNQDQTGAVRPKDGDANGTPMCDIGAVEGDARIPGYGSTPIQPGSLNIGTTTGSAPINTTLEVFETGNATLTVSNPVFSGAHASDFGLVTPFTTFNIADDGNSASIEIRCTPTVDGTRTATFTLNTNDPLNPSVRYDLECHRQAAPTSGFASTPAVAGPLDFGTIQKGEDVTRNLTIFETGNATLNFGNASLSGAHPGDFTFGAFQTSIADGDSAVVIPIACTPSGIGLRTATLSMTSDDPLNLDVSWALVCEGTPPPSPLLEETGESLFEPLNVMDGIYGVAVSPDGLHVYATAFNDDSVLAFERDLVSGEVSYVSSISGPGLDGPQLIAVSPDSKQVYVASAFSNSLVIISRNPSTGFFSIDDTITSSALTGAYGIAVSPNGRFIYVTSLINGSIIGYERLSDDSLAYRAANSVFSNVDLGQPRNLIVSPDGRHLYATAAPISDADNGNIVVFTIDALSGALTHEQTIHEGDLYGGPDFFGTINGLGGAFDVTVSPDGGDVYVVGTHDGAVVHFERDAVDGRLTYRSSLRDGVGGVDGLEGVSGIDITPDGVHVVTTAYNDDAVAVFVRNSNTGYLSQSQIVERGGSPDFFPRLDGARDVDISPDGTTVYAAAFEDDAVVTLNTINPIPVLETLSPASTMTGGSGVTVTLSGQRFLPGAEVSVDGSDRTAVYVNDTTLKAVLSAGDLISAGTLSLWVNNPAPGGGSSKEMLDFTVTAVNENPLPSIDTVLPQGVLAGGGVDVALTVAGENFISTSTIRWNGQGLTTTFVNSATLQATIPAGVLSAVGTSIVTVFNPTPGGGTSNPVGFNINYPWHNLAPTLVALLPADIVQFGVVGESVTVRVQGVDFVQDSQAQWNGEDRPTQYIDETEVEITLTAMDVTPSGTGNIAIRNPTPGGGTSNPMVFTVTRYAYAVFLPLVIR